MNRFFKSFIACICLLVLFVQAGWAADEYTLTLNTQPANAGSFNRSSGQTFAVGASVYMYYNANTDYVFDYWMSGDTIVSRDRYFYFIMPDHDATLTAVFHYDPTSPGNPDSPDQNKKYTLTLNTQPANAGSFNRNSGELFKAGEKVSLNGYNNDGFKFEKWISADTIVSTNRNFNFVMPAHDAELTAVYSYDPSSPANPDTAQVYYNVTLETQPTNAGTFSWNSTTKAVARSSCEVYAYPNSDFTFKEWQMNGETVGTDRRYRFQMPAENIRLVAVYDYTPANPSNPNKNYWNAETGEVIVDDFTAGNLSSAVNNTIGGSNNRDKVQMITVAGPVSQYDWGVVNNYSNCTYLDMSRTYGLTYVPSYNFSDNKSLTTVILPAGIERIEYYAFHNCSNLSSISIYAATPPTIGNRAFEGIGDSIVYVPADALALYQEAEGWKDFTILPLAKEVSALEINLPEGTDPSIYKDMYIELLNTKSGQKQRYVITNRTTYTFNSLIHRTSYNVYLKNAQGDVLGEIDGIDIVDHDVSMTFESLKVPRDLTLKVLTPGGEDVTSQTTITWMDAKDTYLTKGYKLTGQMEGAYAKFRVTLPQTLGMLYLLPTDSLYEVLAENNISITLKAIPQTTITGKVTDIKTGQPLSGATVAISQMLNGLYSKSFTTKTDNKGEWSQTVYEAKTDVTASMSDYVSKTQSFETLVAEVPAFELKDINGTTIAITLTYQPTGGELQEYYSDYANVAYAVFNETTQKQVTEMNVQYPQIVLMEQLAEGTQLRITATSKNQKFVPVTATATVDSLDRANVTLPIMQLGGITATFKQTDNLSVVGILYDKNGYLIKKYDYPSATLTISELQDGDYTLVTMANSQFFNSVATISQFAEAGLREGVDYVKNSIVVKSGELTVVNNQLIPYLDESKLYYTGENTRITVNKSQITAGQYLTIRGQVDFKATYSNDVSNLKMVFNLPNNCTFVDNSVMTGSNLTSYIIEDNRIIVPLNNVNEQVRFCIIPTIGSNYVLNAHIEFVIGKKTILQPIGSANFTVKDLSIVVPSIVASPSIPVIGTANAKSTIEIFDNGVMVGQTTALSNGNWNAVVVLDSPRNLTTHELFAKIITDKGLELQTEVQEVMYDRNAIEPSKVIMINTAHPSGSLNLCEYVTEFDFSNPGKVQKAYWYWPSYPDFTFLVNFTNNDTTVVSNVVLYVLLSDNTITKLYPTFDAKQGCWVTNSKFQSNALPTNVNVSYDALSNYVCDRDQLESEKESLILALNAARSERKKIEDSFNTDIILENQSKYDQLYTLFGQEDTLSSEAIVMLEEIMPSNSVGGEINFDITNVSVDDLIKEIEARDLHRDTLMTGLLDDALAPSEDIILPSEYSYSISTENGIKIINRTLLGKIDKQQLLEDGFEEVMMTDSTVIYIKVTDESQVYIDSKEKVRYEIRMSDEKSDSKSPSNRATIPGGDDASLIKCISDYESIAHSLKDFADAIRGEKNSENIRALLKSVCSTLDGIKGAIECIYENTLKQIFDKFDKSSEEMLGSYAYDEKILKSKEDDVLYKKKLANDDLLRNKENIKKYEKELKQLEQELANASEGEKVVIQSKIDLARTAKSDAEKHVKSLTKEIEQHTKDFNKLEKQLAKNAKKYEEARNFVAKTKSFLNKLPKKLNNPKLLKTFKIAGNIGKVVGTTVGAALQLIPLWLDAYDLGEELVKWDALWADIWAKWPCKDNQSEFLKFMAKSLTLTTVHVGANVSTVGASTLALVLDVTNHPFAWVASLALDIYSWTVGWVNDKYKSSHRESLSSELKRIKCENKDDGSPDWWPFPPDWWPFPPVEHVMDPSGYVYEGVASNRLQGVTATAYYKEMVEDMYGDLHENVVLWNAEDYAQENPLFTDEYGMYQWDVPQGLWQVKFEKEGYQTTYSDWLPVPPPQLDVNIPMTQMLQPTVKSGKAYSEGVEMEFDKYMDPSTLTTSNIMLTKNGNAVSGTIELLNEEVAYEGKTETFASKVRFNVPEGEELLSTDEVQLTVKKAVTSYAGMQMQDDYVQKFDVEPRVRLMAVDSLINVGYGAERTIIVAALPADASKGKKVNVKSLSTMIAAVNNEELTLDENGQAELKVSGELPGSTVLSYTMEDSDVEGLTTVNVKDAAMLVTIAPRASRVSGTQVYRGTKVQLSSETDGAVIYYTLDGSCPCNTETAIKYDADAPIVINDDNVTIKAMAQGHDLAESDVVEFNYSLKTTTLGYTLPEGWTWISHNEETAVPVTEFHTGAERIVSQTQELINDPVAGFIGSLTELQPVVGYKVKQATEGNVRLNGYEWDATKQAVAVETGWNWIGYPVNQVMTVAEALAFFTPSEGDYLVGQNGFVEYADGEWKGTLEGMKPGEGFLYKSGAATEIPFNTTIVSTAGNRAFKRSVLIGSPWAANSRTYPNIMPLTAQLYDNGIKTSDGEYIVGAFVGTECRGVGQWKDGRLMMNINGTGGEELSFMAYNPLTEQMFNINETFKFDSNNLGTWHMPFMLTIGGETTGISISNRDSDFIVTPLVARDHITVTAGGQDISHLTLTDMSGRVVTSLKNLGTGATITTSMLPEGIYIVTAKAGEQMYYRKIVKSYK